MNRQRISRAPLGNADIAVRTRTERHEVRQYASPKCWAGKSTSGNLAPTGLI